MISAAAVAVFALLLAADTGVVIEGAVMKAASRNIP